ncbi:MAG TPA: flagellar biosynthetic protein FliR [Pirellulales bacterium]|nr:flagellar biosynthetic protein FliR [Pirellulales bacterium]
MLGSATDHAGELQLFALILTRVSSMVLIAPVFGAKTIGPRMRATLAVALALVIMPLELERTPTAPAGGAQFVVLLGAEALIGLTLGLGVLVLFSGIQVAAQIIGQMSGLQLADVFNPGVDTNQPALSQLMFYLTLAVFVALGGHRTVMEALLDTFTWLPAGRGEFSRSATEAMTSLLTQSFVLGVRAAAPAMLALLLSTLILGLVSRALPQMNLLVLGFGFQTLVALGVVGLSLGTAAWIFSEQLETTLHTIHGALRLR